MSYFSARNLKQVYPSYVAHFDVCMNPQKINHITIGNYPRKIDEYLALGKPVIATRTKTMSLFEDHVWNCDDTTEYVEAIHTALQTNNQTLIKKDTIRSICTHGKTQ